MKKDLLFILFFGVIAYAGICEVKINKERKNFMEYLSSTRDGIIPGVEKEIKEKELKVTATVYNPVESQCDSDPLITADNSKICLNKLNKGELRWIAISRDLRKHFKYGDVVLLSCESNPEINGEWEVHDTMNSRFSNKIDLLVPEKIKLGKWDDVIIKKQNKKRRGN